jgi:hypothetical protein
LSDLTATLTVRLSPRELRGLRDRARAAGTTPSAIVRAALDQELTEDDDDGPTLGDRSRAWVGVIRSARAVAGRDARAVLAAWDPDRRG